MGGYKLKDKQTHILKLHFSQDRSSGMTREFLQQQMMKKPYTVHDIHKCILESVKEAHKQKQ